MSTPNNDIPFVPENTLDPAAGLNLALIVIDDLLQLIVETVGDNAPPGSPIDGQRHIVGTAPSGDWSGQAHQLAVYDATGGLWRFRPAWLALNTADGYLYKFINDSWSVVTGAGGAAYLGDLLDVAEQAASDGQLLGYDAGAGEWQPQSVPFVQLADTPTAYTGEGGRMLAVNFTETALEFVDPPSGGGGGATTLGALDNVDTTAAQDGELLGFDLADGIWKPYTPTFLAGDDTPASYAGAANQLVAVNATADGLAFIDPPVTGVPEAPQDGKLYGRQNGQWVEITQAAIDAGAVWDGMLYLVDNWGIVEAVDSGTETSSWQNLDDYNGAAVGFYRAAVNATKLFAFDSTGVVWIFNRSDGVFISSFDTLMGWPMGIAADDDDNVYVITSDATDVVKFDSAGTSLWAFPFPQDPGTGWDQTGAALVWGNDGYVYAASAVDNPGFNYLFKIDAGTGTADWAAASTGSDAHATGLAVGPGGTVYVGVASDDESGIVQDHIRKYDSAGTRLWSLPVGQYFSSETKMAVDENGTAYSINNQTDGTATDSTLVITVDTDGNLVDDTKEAITLSGIAARGTTVYLTEYNAADDTNDLVARNAGDWAELWRLPVMDGSFRRDIQAIVYYG